MGAGLVVDLSGFNQVVQSFENPKIVKQLNSIMEKRALAALIGQAIADNFDKEGPGWAPLHPETIRRSVAKKLRKKIELDAAKSLGFKSVKAAKKKSASRFVQHLHKEITRHEVGARIRSSNIEPHRMILQRTGLLKKSATLVGTRGNIYSVSNNEITWGSDLAYAEVQNSGSTAKNIPARPFMVIRDPWVKQIDEYIIQEATRIIEGFFK